MKKSIVFASAMAVFFTAASVYAAPCPMDVKKPCDKTPPMAQKCHKPAPPSPEMQAEMKAKAEARKAEFDKKLNLTEEQKTKAAQIRKEGFEKMKPVMDQMKAKKDEIKAIHENGSLTQAEARAKLDVLHKDMFELKKQAAQIRKQNMQDFENILTDKQKKTLEKMKQEGRKDFAKKHKKHKGKECKKDDNCKFKTMPHRPAHPPVVTPEPIQK